MHICYLLETTELCGGVRIVFDQTRALIDRGHCVCILARTGEHSWYPYPVPVSYVQDFSLPSDPFSSPDIIVGTFWTTIRPALELKTGMVIHLCQGCEWTIPEYQEIYPDIDKVYSLPVPKITIGEWLREQIWERFGKESFPLECVGQIVDTGMFYPPLWSEKIKGLFRQHFRILIVGMFESQVKGIPFALKAVARVREKGFPVHVIRISTLPLSVEEERITGIDEYHQAVMPAEMRTFYSASDILLAPSRSGEGFGLPFAEALSCGLPVVASAIPSHLSLDSRKDYALFVPEGHAESIAEGIMQLISDRKLRRKLAKRGPEVTRQFSASAVARRLEASFEKFLMKGL